MAHKSCNGNKTPNIARCARIREELANDIFNQNCTWLDTEGIKPDGQKYLIAELFSGAGGTTLGFAMAGYESVFSVEIDPDASATYQRHFPTSYHHEGLIEDLTDQQVLSALKGRQVHVLCAGFPCVGFSVAGARNPMDPRNQLFRQVVRFAKLLNPWFVVGENVPGVVTLANGEFYRVIRSEFDQIGYPDMAVRVLESAEYGVAQLRPRAVFIANRFGLPNPFPKPILTEKEFVPIEAAIDDLKHHPRDPSINHEWTWHSKEMEKRLAKIPPGGSLYESYFDAWKRQYRGIPSMTIKENHGGVHVHYELNRTISAREMARLQSFPDEFIFCGRMKRVMFQVGNAVPPLLAKHIALAIRPSLGEICRERPAKTRESALNEALVDAS